MSEGLLLLGFSVLLVMACGIALYPCRAFRMRTLWWVPVIVTVVSLGYAHWGAWPAWTFARQAKEQQQRAQSVLNQVHDPEELIEKLKATLKQQPNSARGWYLLGRLYGSQNRWKEACDAFASAQSYAPDDEEITVNYAHSLWQRHHQTFDEKSRGLLQQVLKKNANQPDALGMLAMDAYVRHDYQQAIDHWQQLLTVAPKGSDAAESIRKAIADAQKKMTNH